MKLFSHLLLILLSTSCNNTPQKSSIITMEPELQSNFSDSTIRVAIIKNISDTSITNNSNRSIDVIFNGVDNYLGGHRNPKLNFTTECLVCETVQAYKQGFIFGKRLYVTWDSVVIFQTNRESSDRIVPINRKSFYGERNPRKHQFSSGSLTMKFQGPSCTDADFTEVTISYDTGTISFNKLINASFFEYDLNNNGKNEQYLLGMRNCSQELVLIRVNENSN